MSCKGSLFSKKKLHKFNRDSLRLERLYYQINEKNYEEEKRKSSFEKKSARQVGPNCNNISSLSFVQEYANQLLLKKENNTLKREIQHLNNLIDSSQIFETECSGRVCAKYPMINLKKKISLRLWEKENALAEADNSNNISSARKGLASATKLDYKKVESIVQKSNLIVNSSHMKIIKPRLSYSPTNVYSSTEAYLPTDFSGVNNTNTNTNTNSTWSNNERNVFVTNMNKKRLSELEAIYRKICSKDIKGINEDVWNYFSEHDREMKSSFDPCNRTVDPNFVQKMLLELRNKITFTNVPEIIKSYTTRNGRIDINSNQVQKVQNLDSELYKLQFTLVRELAKLSKN